MDAYGARPAEMLSEPSDVGLLFRDPRSVEVTGTQAETSGDPQLVMDAR